jgi:hypothetical protein
MHRVSDWLLLAQQEIYLSGVEYFLSDQDHLWQQFYGFAQSLKCPLYFWNPGCASVRQVVAHQQGYRLQPTDQGHGQMDILPYLLEQPEQPGIYLLEGVLPDDPTGSLSELRLYQLVTAYQQLRWSTVPHYWVLLAEHIQSPARSRSDSAGDHRDGATAALGGLG